MTPYVKVYSEEGKLLNPIEGMYSTGRSLRKLKRLRRNLATKRVRMLGYRSVKTS